MHVDGYCMPFWHAIHVATKTRLYESSSGAAHILQI